MTTPTPNAMPAQAPAGTGGTPEQGAQAAAAAAGGQQLPPPNEPTITQSHMNHLLAEQKREFQTKYGDYDDRVAKAEAYDALIATTRTTEEQAADVAARLATTERDKASLETDKLRYRLAGASQIPADLWDMIGGTDEASIKANIEKLKQHTTPPADPAGGSEQQQSRRPAPVGGQGQSGSGGNGGFTGNGLAGGRDLYNSRHKKQDAKSSAQ